MGENAPKKNIEGLNIFLKENKSKEDFCIYLYGDENKINQEIKRLNVPTKSLKIIHTENVVSDKETPLTAIKNSKNTSMWNSVQAQSNGDADITLSAGNTGVLLVISRMILKTMQDVSKPALAGLY